MVDIVGPFYKDAEGFTKVQYPPRKVPKRMWDNPEHRKDLVQGGMRLADDINTPSPDEGPKKGRPTNEAKALKEAQEKLAAMEERMAAMEAAAKPTTEVTKSAITTKPSADATK